MQPQAARLSKKTISLCLSLIVFFGLSKGVWAQGECEPYIKQFTSEKIEYANKFRSSKEQEIRDEAIDILRNINSYENELRAQGDSIYRSHLQELNESNRAISIEKWREELRFAEQSGGYGELPRSKYLLCMAESASSESNSKRSQIAASRNSPLTNSTNTAKGRGEVDEYFVGSTFSNGFRISNNEHETAPILPPENVIFLTTGYTKRTSTCGALVNIRYFEKRGLHFFAKLEIIEKATGRRWVTQTSGLNTYYTYSYFQSTPSVQQFYKTNGDNLNNFYDLGAILMTALSMTGTGRPKVLEDTECGGWAFRIVPESLIVVGR